MFPGGSTEEREEEREFRLGGRKVAPFEHATRPLSLFERSARREARHASEGERGKETRLIEINSIARIIIAAYPRIK